tara:strand:+ start:173 stop:808 length:636 start_codon:yes stop_codon:yes gene_type:complete
MRRILLIILSFLLSCEKPEKRSFDDYSDFYKNTLERNGSYTLYNNDFPYISEVYKKGNIISRSKYYENSLKIRMRENANSQTFFYRSGNVKSIHESYKGGKKESINVFWDDMGAKQKELYLYMKDGTFYYHKNDINGNAYELNNFDLVGKWPDYDNYPCILDRQNSNHSWDQFYDQYENLTWRCRGVDNGQYVSYCNCSQFVKDDRRWPEK